MLEKAHVEKSAVEDVSLPTQEDYDAVVRSVKDYAEGWYDGDPERALEAAHGIEVPPRAVWLRALMAELERLANHFGDIGAVCNDAAF